jgi:hypothetical protein
VDQSPGLPAPGISRRGLLKGGLIVGVGAAGLSVASAAARPGVARASQTAGIRLVADYGTALNTDVQTQWAYCGLCRNLYYTAEGGLNGFCAYWNVQAELGYGFGSYVHSPGSETNYGVMIDNPGFVLNENPPLGAAYLQSPWRFCSECYCLFWGNGQADSWCPVAFTSSGQVPHNDSGSGVYYMPSGMDGKVDAWSASGATPQPGWRYCSDCKSLYWGGAWQDSNCQYMLQNTGYPYQHATGATVYTVFMM